MSLMTNGKRATKQPMKRNPIFCVSPVPNQVRLRGMKTMMGTYAPAKASGRKKAATDEKVAI